MTGSPTARSAWGLAAVLLAGGSLAAERPDLLATTTHTVPSPADRASKGRAGPRLTTTTDDPSPAGRASKGGAGPRLTTTTDVPSPAGRPSAERLGPLHAVGDNALDAFAGGDAMLHVAAIAVTPPLVLGGADAHIHRFFGARPALGHTGWPARIGGVAAPALVAGGLWLHGVRHDEDEPVVAAWAVVQSVGLAVTWVTLLKAVTGRPKPGPDRGDEADEQARVFRFGFGRGGVVEGWPSGHVAAVAATGSALAAFYPDEAFVAWLGAAAVAYTAYGVTAFGQGSMHWASDALAGAFVGHAFGHTVGARYRADWSGSAPPAASPWRLTPMAGAVGLTLVVTD